MLRVNVDVDVAVAVALAVTVCGASIVSSQWLLSQRQVERKSRMMLSDTSQMRVVRLHTSLTVCQVHHTSLTAVCQAHHMSLTVYQARRTSLIGTARHMSQTVIVCRMRLTVMVRRTSLTVLVCHTILTVIQARHRSLTVLARRSPS